MPRSVLLDGIAAENADAARAQVWTFDHATVIHEIGRRVPGLVASASRKLRFVEPIGRFIPAAFSERAPDDPTRHARDDNIILPITSTDWRAAKLSRLLSHFDLRRASTFSEVELLDLCLEAEARAVELMTRLAGPGQSKRGQTPFEGTSVVHLAQYVLRRLFRELDEGFAVKPPQEQERIAADVAKLLSDLPAALQERIREEADLADLSAAALKKTGAIAAVGGALVGTVGIAGFAAYTTFTSVIAASAGVFGVTLPFAVYLHATAALAFLSNPLVLGAATLVGGRFAVTRANRQIRDQFLPIMVATGVMASATNENLADAPTEIVGALAKHASMHRAGDPRLRAQIGNTFPWLPRTR